MNSIKETLSDDGNNAGFGTGEEGGGGGEEGREEREGTEGGEEGGDEAIAKDFEDFLGVGLFVDHLFFFFFFFFVCVCMSIYLRDGERGCKEEKREGEKEK